MQKTEYYQLIGKRLSKAMELLHYNQQQILLKCSEQGFEISQSALSKMLSGTSIQTLQLVQVCKILGLNLSGVLSLDVDTETNWKILQKPQSDQVITDARHKAFRGYRGEYSVYFYTTKNEDSIHQGYFTLTEDRENRLQ